MKKYLQIFEASWSSGFVYRLNFVMWRVRVVLQILAIFFLWRAILGPGESGFGYTSAEMLTYVIGTSFIRSLVFSSRSTDIQAEVSSGDLNNQIIKPYNYFGYWFSRDLADKVLNILFSIVEIGLLIVIIKPELVLPYSMTHMLMFIVFAVLAMVMYFFFSLIISLTTFWMPEGNGWPQRFFVFVILEFVAGGVFPLDILPAPVYAVVANLPTTYMLFTPLQAYLGRMEVSSFIPTVVIMGTWTVIFYLISRYMFSRGLRVYGAYGR